MSGLPPTLATQPVVSTPADEWAAETTNALETKRASGVATGGPRAVDSGPSIPGAFPGEFSAPSKEELEKAAAVVAQEAKSAAYEAKTVAQEVIQKAREYLPDQEEVKRTVQSVSQSAAQYIPAGVTSAGQTAAQYLPVGVTNTINSYLPASGTSTGTGTHLSTAADVAVASEHDKPHIKSMPSQELTGIQPHEHVEGAGELPGTIFESGVARLPDDRTPGTQTPAAAGSGPRSGSPAFKATQKAPVLGAGLDSKILVEDQSTTHTSLPSAELQGAQPYETSGGIGSLPGAKKEFGVAVLPEEKRDHVNSLPSHEQGGAQPYEASQGVGALPGSRDEGGVAVLPEEKQGGAGQNKSITSKVSEVKEKAKEATKEKVGSSDKVGSSPPQPNLKPREWTTWQGVGGVSASTDDADSMDAEVRDQAADWARTQHADEDVSSKQDTAQHHQSEPAKPSQALSSSGATASPNVDQHSVGSDPEGKGVHKPKFMERVKGEAKILAGKFSGDKTKVEEGKQLKGGEA